MHVAVCQNRIEKVMKIYVRGLVSRTTAKRVDWEALERDSDGLDM